MAAQGGDVGALRCSRRQLLARIALLLGARVLVGAVPAARAGAATPAGDGRHPGLRESDRLLAALGGRLAADEPALAAALAGAVAAEMAALRTGTDAERARRARALLLRPARVRDDFARGDIVPVDGWVLARSEAAACVWLHALDVRSPGAG